MNNEKAKKVKRGGKKSRIWKPHNAEKTCEIGLEDS